MKFHPVRARRQFFFVFLGSVVLMSACRPGETHRQDFSESVSRTELQTQAPPQTETTLLAAPKCAAASAGARELRIHAGDHFDDSGAYWETFFRAANPRACSVEFEVMFPMDESCGGTADYQVCGGGLEDCTSNQSPSTHWNKLFGIGQLGGGWHGRFQYSSLRLGWRHRSDLHVFELGPYVHDGCNTANGCGIYLENAQQRIRASDNDLSPLRIEANRWVHVELTERGNAYTAIIDGRRFDGVYQHRNRRSPQSFDTAYFGGVPTAPKDILLLVRNVRTRRVCTDA